MATKLFLNIPVKNIERTNAFFTTLGFQFNPAFSDEKATCMILSDDGYVMLLQEEFFKGFTPKPIADAHQTAQAIIGISADSREGVDALYDKAIAMGATESKEAYDYGFMYGHSFNDLDGHIWEVFWMDPQAPPPHG